MRPPKYELKEFATEDDSPNIDSIMVMDDAVNRHNRDVINTAFAGPDVDFDKNDIGIGLQMSEVPVAALQPFSLDWNPVYESMPVG